MPLTVQLGSLHLPIQPRVLTLPCQQEASMGLVLNTCLSNTTKCNQLVYPKTNYIPTAFVGARRNERVFLYAWDLNVLIYFFSKR